jgi:hypothetical protein
MSHTTQHNVPALAAEKSVVRFLCRAFALLFLSSIAYFLPFLIDFVGGSMLIAFAYRSRTFSLTVVTFDLEYHSIPLFLLSFFLSHR